MRISLSMSLVSYESKYEVKSNRNGDHLTIALSGPSHFREASAPQMKSVPTIGTANYCSQRKRGLKNRLSLPPPPNQREESNC